MRDYTMRFLETVKKTRMTKSYKMPLLLSLMQENELADKISLDKLADFFRNFYSNPIYRHDLNDLIHHDFDKWSDEKLKAHIARNPINAFLNTAPDIFFFNNEVFGIKQKVYDDLISDNAFILVQEEVMLRLADYYMRKFRVNI